MGAHCHDCDSYGPFWSASHHAGMSTQCAQVSRLFSALLQLANVGNLVIMRADGSPAQPFALQLRSLHPAHAHFADYRAPSFLQAKVMALHGMRFCADACAAYRLTGRRVYCMCAGY